MPINHNYLRQQFADYAKILKKIGRLAQEGDYTLGKQVDEFEANIRKLTGSRHAIGVGSGTDAIFLSLKASGIGNGDEVITTPYTFVATIGAIVATGAKPVFADIGEDYNLDPALLVPRISARTKAILPVHWSGLPCRMDAILNIARQHHLSVIEDSCHGIRAYFKGKAAGTFGLCGCFSMHPLKNLNVWGDGGYIVTDSDEIYKRLMLLRNHGLADRNECRIFGYNSRLDSIQAIVANHLLQKIDAITKARIDNARLYDEVLREIKQIIIPPRRPDAVQVYHLYIVRAERRDELQKYLLKNGIDAKVHYPVPMHLQPAAKIYGYKAGDFPVCERTCKSVISLPVHEFITEKQIKTVAKKIKEFYA
ncbi:MAG: DegT/DnrJ/EryC1/StrS family aminotransferase [Kiritimatiellae bacterium]|nr:DegT/DnrJ/EryC1/StrS family aminotransferase [Verrucomicrobiota bacterium]MBU4291503.1 DegT/DnrJ/EryC1/StrS family aminotransferase [Verrucomicrobiota bacterium]MCG2678664.1 DegT/DnrJ/EryC1/StrS family aminotransferase [Kiritimatiellia bacterium]